jgi:anti-sigma factor RsiW
MECSHPPPLADEQILAMLDGDAAPQVSAHLADCASCAARLDDTRQVEQRLTGRLYRWDCPAPQQLGDYCLGLASANDADMIAQHLVLCAACSAEMEVLRAFMSANAASPVLAPRPPARPVRPWLGDLIARVLPSAPAQATALRGAATRSITAEAGHTTIILEVQPDAEGWVTLRGQLLEADQDRWIGALVELRQTGVLATTTLIDEVGGFSCGLLRPEPAELRITPEIGRSVLVPQIELAA